MLRHISHWIFLLILIPGSVLLGAGDTLSISIFIADVVSVEEQIIPREFAVHPPYPNPFNPDVRFTVDIPQEADTRVSILNLRGQEIAVLENTKLQPGRYEYQWKAVEYSSGLYFVRVRSAQFESVTKISLLK